MAKTEKAIIFEGTGYHIIRSDPRNLELHVLIRDKEGKENYQFKGYFRTVEGALAYLVSDSSLLDETVTHNIESYLQSITDAKHTVIDDIKKQLAEPEPKPEDLDEFF